MIKDKSIKCSYLITKEEPLLDLKKMDEKKIIEGALYLLDRPVSYEELAEIIQADADKVDNLVEQLRDELLDRQAAYFIFDIKPNLVQLKLREEVVARIKYPFIQRSEVPEHLLRTLALIAFKQYVTQQEVTPNKLKKALGKDPKEKISELESLGLINIQKKGNRNIITVTEQFLELFKLPKDPAQTRLALQHGLKDYAIRELRG